MEAVEEYCVYIDGSDPNLQKELGVFKRFILPIASVICCAFMVFAAVYAHGVTPYLAAKEAGGFSFPVLFYLIVFAVIIVIGYFCNRRSCRKNAENDEE